MSKLIYFLLVFLICLALPALSSAAGKRPDNVWNFYHFDGIAFKSGPAVDGNAYFAIREKLLPVVLTAQTAHIEQTELPDGTGAIVGIGYIQSSGGKHGVGRGFKPSVRLPLLILTEGKEFVTVQTDINGYFVAVLPTGVYSIGNEPSITVERGIATLVPIKVGKRMVD